MNTPDVTARLLSESAWLQRLARSLVVDASTADDLAQETLLEAFERPPARAEGSRGWLARVLERRIAKRRRTEARRHARELASARAESVDPARSAEERMRRHAALVQRVQSLDEPYRTAIVLRYFDDLPPREIAARLGVPVATVLSRIQRGLAVLRSELDAEYGGREEWLGALAAVAWPRAEGALASTTLLGAPVLMSLKAWILLVAATLAVWFFFSTREHASSNSVAESSAAVEITRDRSGGGPTSSNSNDTSRANARAAGSSSERPNASRGTRRGRVVDARGRPLAGVPVLHHGLLWPTWQSGDLGWINDGENGLFLPPEEVERLRADPRAAAECFARFRVPEAWRAVVFDEPLPNRTVVTDASGEFVFDGDEVGPRCSVFGRGWMQLARGEELGGSVLLVVAAAVRIGGRVLDLDLAPIAGARVEPRWSPELALAPELRALALEGVWDPASMNADDEGRYLLRAVPVGLFGCDLVASATGRETREVPVPLEPNEAFDIVLPGGLGSGLEIDGVVLAPDRAPVAGAEVVFGRDRTQTDADGRFRFAGVEPVLEARLSALHPSYAPVQRFGLVERVLRDRTEGRGLELVFPAVTRTLRGVVLDAEGNGLPGWKVNLFDPTLLDITFTPVEGGLGGWERAVETRAGGAFELTGLAERAYRLRVWKEGTASVFVSDSIRAREQDVVVRIPPSAFFELVRGRVVSRDGALPTGLQVAVVYPIHVTHGGGGSMTEGLAPSPIRPDGRFEIARVPRSHAEIVVGTQGGLVRSLPVEAIGADGTVEIEFVEARTLRILGEALGASAIVVGADDAVFPVEVLGTGTRSRIERLSSIDGAFPPSVIPASARWLLLERADASWSRIAIEDDGYGVSRAVLPR